METLATHNGTFHGDEVTAVALIKTFIEKDLIIIRTRDEELIRKADIVLDVGMIYDPENFRFDHHQKNCEEDLSSAGMVLKNLDIDKDLKTTLHNSFIKGIDDVDIGKAVAISNGMMSLSGLISTYNADDVYSKKQDEQFLKAVELVEILIQRIIHSFKNIIEDEKEVSRRLMNLKSNGILELPGFMHWQKAVIKHGKVTRVIFPVNNKWTCVVPLKSFETFELNAPKLAGYKSPEVVFIHKAGFTGAAKTREEIYKLAEYNLDQ